MKLHAYEQVLLEGIVKLIVVANVCIFMTVSLVLALFWWRGGVGGWCIGYLLLGF